MMKFMPWNKKNDNEEPELDALLDSGPALAESAFDDDSDRSSEEEDLLNQYLNSDNDSDDDAFPSAGSLPDSTESPPAVSETQDIPVGVPSGGSDDEPDEDDGSIGFEIPLDSDENKGDDSGGDLADDVMSIFDEEEEADEDIAALSRWLIEIDAAELLAEARLVARKLSEMLSE